MTAIKTLDVGLAHAIPDAVDPALISADLFAPASFLDDEGDEGDEDGEGYENDETNGGD